MNHAQTLLVHNIPSDSTTSDLAEAFSDIGPIKRCHAVTDPETGKCTKGVGYVTFALNSDADKALKSTIKLSGNILKLKYTKSREDVGKKFTPVDKVEQKKKSKEQSKLFKTKRRRVIVRNLSFKCNDEQLKKEFSKFGAVTEVTIPKKEDGKMKGFAIVGFSSFNSATKAVKEMNAKPILGRPVAVDFLLPKESFVKEAAVESEVDEDKEIKGEDKESVKDRLRQKSSQRHTQQPSEEESDADSDEDESMNDTKEMKDDSDYEEEEEEEEKEDDDDDEDDRDEDLDEDRDSLSTHKNTRKKTDDAAEGKTIFIKNVSFTTTEEQLKELLQNFGTLAYVKITRDPVTGHSRGTAFAKFEEVADVATVLDKSEKKSSELFLDGRQLEIIKALTREQTEKLYTLKHAKSRDKRNLYLAAEGRIYPESKAAEGVSEADLAMRLELEKRKRESLRNLHCFISPRRLCIHNLPADVNDKKLRQLFTKAVADKSAKITEAKVFYNRKSDGKFGASKGFGFVAFDKHKHALIALRRLNNNPQTFTVTKRPIVEFTVENRKALLQKQRRGEKDTYSDDNFDPILESDVDIEPLPYMGSTARPLKDNEKVAVPKMNRKMFEMKKKLKERKKAERATKKAVKGVKERTLIRKEKQMDRQPKRKKNKVKEIDQFEEKFLNKRKRAFSDVASAIDTTRRVSKKSKWYKS